MLYRCKDFFFTFLKSLLFQMEITPSAMMVLLYGLSKLTEFLPGMKLDTYSFELHQCRADK